MDNASLINAVQIESGALILAVKAGHRTTPCHLRGLEVSDLAVHVGEFCGFWSHVLSEGTGRPKAPFPILPRAGTWPVVGRTSGIWSRAQGGTGGHPGVDLVRSRPHGRVRGPTLRPRAGRPPLRRAVGPGHLHPDPGRAGRRRDRRGPRHPDHRPRPLRPGHRAGYCPCAPPDVGSEWLVTLEPDRIEVERRTQDEAPREGGDLVVSGTASDLELTLYHRPTLSPVDVARRLHRAGGMAPRVHLLNRTCQSGRTGLPSGRTRSLSEPKEPEAGLRCPGISAGARDQPADRVRPARSPRVTNLVAILREASSIISSPNMTAPDRSSSVALR